MARKLRLTLPILATIITLSFFGISQAANVCNIENSPPIVDIEVRYGIVAYGVDGFRCYVNVIHPDKEEVTIDYSWSFTGTNLDESLFDGEGGLLPEHFFFIENASIRCKATVTNSDGQSTKVTSRKFSTQGYFKRVFGTMNEVSGNFGGVSDADNICQEEAEFYGVPGQYKAWISDSSVSPKTSFTNYELQYINVLGDVFADKFNDILNNDLPDDAANPALVLDTYSYPDGFANDYIWTGTFWDGQNFGYEFGNEGPVLVIMENCNDWTGGGEAHVGVVGTDTYQADHTWTYDYYQKKSCNDVAALVCIEQ